MSNLIFKPEAVKISHCAVGTEAEHRVFWLEDENNPANYRYLTASEQQQFEAWEAAEIEKHKHDDDGYGAAIGASTEAADAAADLGLKWNAPEGVEKPASIADAYALYQAGTAKGSFSFEHPRGPLDPASMEQMRTVAHQMVDESFADPINKRMAVLIFHMENADPITTAASGVSRVTRASTASDEAILEYAERLAYDQLFDAMQKSEAFGEPANKLEI